MLISLTTDIKQDLHTINELAKIRDQRHEFFSRLSRLIQYHSDAKQLSRSIYYYNFAKKIDTLKFLFHTDLFMTF